MTIKELAEFTARTERTVRRWISKVIPLSDTMAVKMSDAMKTNKPADFTLEETELILRNSTVPKVVVDSLMDQTRTKELAVNSMNNQLDMFKTMSDIMAQSMAEALKPLYNRLDNLENKQPNQLLLPSEPQEEPRAYLNRLVREYAQLKGVDFKVAWNILYTEMLYRCKTNIKVKAKNEGIKPIDYLEQSNLILTACSIMKGLING